MKQIEPSAVYKITFYQYDKNNVDIMLAKQVAITICMLISYGVIRMVA